MFSTKEIEVNGFLHFQFEDVAIYLTSADTRKEALWIELADTSEYKVLKKLHNKRIRLKGIYDKNEKGHLAQYAGTLKNASVK